MAIVIGSPIPADELGPLDPLLTAVQAEWQSRGGCARLLRNHTLKVLYTLQWRSRRSYSMTIVSEVRVHLPGDGSLTM